MNITSLLKKGMKNVKQKLKIKATTDGVIVEGKKCKTAESLVKNVKKIAKKDKSKGVTYGATWGEIAVAYRNTLLSKSFKLDENSEEFYKKFIHNFKDKVVVPAMLDKFYDKYTKDINLNTKLEKIAPVYVALSFYAMREKIVSNLSTEHIKLEPVEYLGVTYNTPDALIKGANEICEKAKLLVIESANIMSKKYTSIENELYRKYPNVFESYYGSKTDFGTKYSSIKSEIDGLRRNLISAINQISKLTINKENMSREYAAFANLREYPEKFQAYFTTNKLDKSIDSGSYICICANYISNAENIIATAKGYASIFDGKEIDATTRSKIAPEALENAKKFKKMVDELENVSKCKNEQAAIELAKNTYKRKATLPDLPPRTYTHKRI